MEQFKKVALIICNLSLEVTMHHLLTTLRPEPFPDNLFMKLATDLDELRQGLEKFMKLEELRDFQNKARNPNEASHKGPSKPPLIPQKKFCDTSWLQQFVKYTPVNSRLERDMSVDLMTILRRTHLLPNADQNTLC